MGSRSPANISGTPSWLVRTAFVLALLAGGYLLFELGRIQGGYSVVRASTDTRNYESLVFDLEQEIISLNEEIELQRTHRDIEREAYNQVEANLVDLQQKIQEQRDAIEFYRGIMSPEDGERGLRVQGVKLSRGAEEREYLVRLVLIQVMKNGSSVQGDVGLTLEGAENGESKTYSLEELVPADQDSSWPFKFRYFQSFDRSLVLPDGFTPERLNVEIRSRTRSVDSVEQTFAWHTVQG